MLRFNFNDNIEQIEAVKNSTFNTMRTSFSKAMLTRFHQVKTVIEDVWDLDNTKALLAGRLQTIAAKDPSTWTVKNLLDMSLICCLLWNGVEDETEE